MQGSLQILLCTHTPLVKSINCQFPTKTDTVLDKKYMQNRVSIGNVLLTWIRVIYFYSLRLTGNVGKPTCQNSRHMK